MSRPILEVAGVHKRYGDVPALTGVSFQVGEGEIVGLLGPNGAGKSTLISIICGLRRADEGRVAVAGIDVRAHPQRARSLIGLAPQDTGIYPMVTVAHNLQLFADLGGASNGGGAEQIERLAAALDLTGLLGRKAGELSGGQKRRLHTAIALLNEPKLVLLDEATTGADVESRARLLETVMDLATRGSSVVYSTHYLNEVEDLGADVVILEQGNVIASGPVRDLIAGHGASVVEFTIDGQLPPSLNGHKWSLDESVLRVPSFEPARTAARILSELGAEAVSVKGIEIIRPSLETVYLGLTGRRYREGEGHVVAA